MAAFLCPLAGLVPTRGTRTAATDAYEPPLTLARCRWHTRLPVKNPVCRASAADGMTGSEGGQRNDDDDARETEERELRVVEQMSQEMLMACMNEVAMYAVYKAEGGGATNPPLDEGGRGPMTASSSSAKPDRGDATSARSSSRGWPLSAPDGAGDDDDDDDDEDDDDEAYDRHRRMFGGSVFQSGAHASGKLWSPHPDGSQTSSPEPTYEDLSKELEYIKENVSTLQRRSANELDSVRDILEDLKKQRWSFYLLSFATGILVTGILSNSPNSQYLPLVIAAILLTSRVRQYLAVQLNNIQNGLKRRRGK